MNTPEISIGYVANLWSRMMHFESVGDTEYGHTHQFDHLTLLAKGKLKVTVEGIATEFEAPHMIYIQKDKNHELVALEAGTVAYCIHALRVADQSDILDPSMIPTGINVFTTGMVGDIRADATNAHPHGRCYSTIPLTSK
jgi:hypothetical protein